jgi:hypothetical protein
MKYGNFSRFYLTGVHGIYPVTNFMEMEEVILIKAKSNPGTRIVPCSA